MLPHLLHSKDRAAPLLTVTIRFDKLLEAPQLGLCQGNSPSDDSTGSALQAGHHGSGRHTREVVMIQQEGCHFSDCTLTGLDASAQAAAIAVSAAAAALGVVDGQRFLILWFEDSHVCTLLITDEIGSCKGACVEAQQVVQAMHIK